MSRAEAETVIKNIIQEIVQECAVQGESVSETLVAFMVKAVVLDPRNLFSVDRTLTKDDVQKLIQLCVERLLNKQSPSLETIKMQVYFDMNYTTRDEFLGEHHRVTDLRLLPVVREITDSRARTRDEQESLYRKTVSYVLLRTGLGSATDVSVVREATAALQSVFPQSELGTFLALQKRDKERQLQELAMIVTGIRLFNKDCGKGGEGIEDLPAVLNEAVPAAMRDVENELKRVLHDVSRYTALAEKLAQSSENDGNLTLLKDAVINCRQNEAYLRVVQNDVGDCAERVAALESQLSTRIQQLHATVQYKNAVPTAQVYPQFMHLAQLWVKFQDEMVMLSVLSNLLLNLESFVEVNRVLLKDDDLDQQLEGKTVRSDEDRLNETRGPEYRVVPSKDMRITMEWLFPETTKNFAVLPLQYKGYCGWTLANFDRLLVPSNPEIGVLHYKDYYYAFSSKDAAEEFSTDPDLYAHKIGECAKRSPELIQLLELHTQFAAITPYTQTKESGKLLEKPVTKTDSGTQTDTHFHESNIVASYEWNEWELRRKALKLANLRRKATHSVQTNSSNMRRDNVAQCYPPKDLATQTRTDRYSNVPKPQVFLAGLRGGGMSVPTDMTKIDLTLDVDQN